MNDLSKNVSNDDYYDRVCSMSMPARVVVVVVVADRGCCCLPCRCCRDFVVDAVLHVL